MEAPQANNNKTIICPIVTIWIIFLINLIDLNSYIYDRYRYYILSIFFLNYLLSTLLLLVIGILITLGIERGKNKLYHIGFIITIIYTIIQIIYIILLFINNPKKLRYIITLLIYLLLDLIPFIVLLLYRKKVQENSQGIEAIRNINIDLQEGNNQLIQ